MLYEPYVNLPTTHGLRYWTEKDTAHYVHSYRQNKKMEFYTAAFDYLKEFDIIGDYFEFGIHQARTFSMALVEAQRFGRKEMKFHAFDSFCGLPEADENHKNSNFTKGRFATSEDNFKKLISPYLADPSVLKTIRGYYEETLTSRLIEEYKSDQTKLSLVTFDCDLASSFHTSLEFSKHFFQDGTVVYIDDWRNSCRGNPQGGLQKVWADLERTNEFFFSPFLDIGWWGKSFIVHKHT